VSDDKPTGFVSDRTVDTDGVVGARWWNQALIEADKSSSRRGCLKVLGIGALSVVTCKAICGEVSCGDDEVDMSLYAFESRRSLELQRAYGWDFGATGEPLVFDGVETTPFDPMMIAGLEQDLSPTVFASLHVPTLLQSPNAVPTGRPAEETAPFEPLASKLRPISTPAMQLAYARGRELARLLAAATARVALVVDLPGPESVALAAGAAEVFEPVFLFDNWPHPHGVVPSHLVLAAALHYQPLFVKARAVRRLSRLPMFLLDRARLANYTDLANQFDNRYIARLPSLPAVQTAAQEQVQWLLYVVNRASDLPELDDLNDAFVGWQAASVPVRALSLDVFTSASDGSVSYSGSDSPLPQQFLADYPEDGGGGGVDVGIDIGGGDANPARSYKPSSRTTTYRSGAPFDFGTTSVVLAAGTSAVLGARYDRRGSWNRTGG